MFTLSDGFSLLSLVFYSIVYFPQFYVIIKTKSSDGISIYMMFFYTLADSLSLAGTLLLVLQLNLVAIGWFHLIMSICMLITIYIYSDKKSVFKGLILVILIMSIIAICIWIHIDLYNSFKEFIIVGTSIAWVTTSFYIIGRIPQLIHNYKRRSTEGLSKLMYVFTILGNLFYLLSTVTYSIEPDYIYLNIPWIILTIVNSCLDTIVIIQYYYYKKYRHNQIDNQIDNQLMIT
jgi:uncharacterized protein with PQ loop repeat